MPTSSVPLLPPALNIPSSSAVVDVSVIDTTARIEGLPAAMFFGASIRGHEKLNTPTFSFLIEHNASGTRLLFDLGVAKNWEHGSPFGELVYSNSASTTLTDGTG